MSSIIDLTKQRFGRLIVLRKAPPKNKRVCWECLCNCGNKVIVRGFSLRSGNTQSCGCLQREATSKIPYWKHYRKSFGEAAFNQLYRAYKNDSKNRNLQFSLSKKEFKKLVSGDCYYCGVKPLQVSHLKNGNGDYIYNGIDRLDNSKGYIIENCVSCCKECNFLKSNRNYKDFISKITKILKHLGVLNGRN